MTVNNHVATWILQVATKVVNDSVTDPKNKIPLYLESSSGTSNSKGGGSLRLTTDTRVARYDNFENQSELAEIFGFGAKPVPINKYGEVISEIEEKS